MLQTVRRTKHLMHARSRLGLNSDGNLPTVPLGGELDKEHVDGSGASTEVARTTLVSGASTSALAVARKSRW